MRTILRCALPLLLSALALEAAAAGTCNVTVQGAKIVDDEPCTIRDHGNLLAIDQGAAGRIVVRSSILRASFTGQGLPRLRGSRRSGLTSYGVVVRSSSDDKLCFFNQKITVCVDR